MFAALCLLALMATPDAEPAPRLADYRAELDSFRQEFGGTRDLPDARLKTRGAGRRLPAPSVPFDCRRSTIAVTLA